MKEETINKLTEKALEYLNSAEAFASEQVPAYIEELLSFKVMEHLVAGISGTSLFTLAISVILLAFVFGFIIDILRIKETGRRIKLMSISTLIVVPSMFAIGLCFQQEHFMDAYKAHKAPRVYLVEYFKGQVK